ncbi:MAG: hypothetical protein WC683_01315 [bacterium]
MYLHACTPGRHLRRLCDSDGHPNVVALYRRTRRGQRQEVCGRPLGGAGVHGGGYYVLRLGSDGVLYCSCADYFHRGHAWNRAHPGAQPYACKHVIAAMAHYAGMIERGVSRDREMIVYRPEVLVAEAGRRAAVSAAAARRTA